MDGRLNFLLVPLRWQWLRGFGSFLLLGAAVYVVHPPDASHLQPIAFNHAKHIQNGLACMDCHTGVETQAHAALPELATCMNCHQTALSKSAEEGKLRTIAATGKELVWTQLTRVPAHVYFSHRRHVVLAKVACATCHGPMDKASAPPARAFRTFTMETCIGCHEKYQAGTDCNDCHR